jgi:hypothetical protein
MTNAIYDQDSVRLRIDDGTESGATWQLPVNTDGKVSAGRLCRSRYLLQETGGKGWTSV